MGIFNPTIRAELRSMRASQKSRRTFKRFSKKRKQLSTKWNAKLTKGLVRKKVLKGEENQNKKEKQILEILSAMNEADSLVQRGVVTRETIDKCNELETLFEQYGVDNIQALIQAINQPLMDEFGVTTMNELLDTLPKSNLENLEVAYQQKKISYQDYNFYVFNSSKLGWKNLDEFLKLPLNQFASFKVMVSPTNTTACKLVFKDRQFVLTGQIGKKHYSFEGIPKGEKAWLVGIRYINGQPLFALKEMTISTKDVMLVFEELSLEELKEKLKVIDF